ncbi:hypothetical protein M0812_22679 [Anaeramoeba flamelloides]|uniref:Uncharacterized protein n=1 Tax=Anaeramoeba flamelloides TaxID=1746091 RepID=A0AAV7Z0Z3_9EUKA|nr:hypothetical protein M0812_22679 [Anaeramoeba flamelloides]
MSVLDKSKNFTPRLRKTDKKNLKKNTTPDKILRERINNHKKELILCNKRITGLEELTSQLQKLHKKETESLKNHVERRVNALEQSNELRNRMALENRKYKNKNRNLEKNNYELKQKMLQLEIENTRLVNKVLKLQKKLRMNPNNQKTKSTPNKKKDNKENEQSKRYSKKYHTIKPNLSPTKRSNKKSHLLQVKQKNKKTDQKMKIQKRHKSKNIRTIRANKKKNENLLAKQKRNHHNRSKHDLKKNTTSKKKAHPNTKHRRIPKQKKKHLNDFNINQTLLFKKHTPPKKQSRISLKPSINNEHFKIYVNPTKHKTSPLKNEYQKKVTHRSHHSKKKRTCHANDPKRLNDRKLKKKQLKARHKPNERTKPTFLLLPPPTKDKKRRQTISDYYLNPPVHKDLNSIENKNNKWFLKFRNKN